MRKFEILPSMNDGELPWRVDEIGDSTDTVVAFFDTRADAVAFVKAVGKEVFSRQESVTTRELTGACAEVHPPGNRLAYADWEKPIC